MVTLIFLKSLCRYVWTNILTLSSPRVAIARKKATDTQLYLDVYMLYVSLSLSLCLINYVPTRVVKLLLIVIVIVMKRLWHESNSNSNRLLKIPE